MISATFLVVVLFSASCECLLIGGRIEINLTHPVELEHITQLATFGMKSIAIERELTNDTTQSNKKHKLAYSLLNITSARRQLVAGVNYFITIEMQPQNCTDDDATPCELKREECEMIIFENVWLNYTELTGFNCMTRRHLLGGRNKIANDDANALLALNYVVAQMNMKSSEPVYYVPIVQNIYKQIVNGIKYTYEFDYAPSNCLIEQENMKEFKSDECKVDETKAFKTCVVIVWDKFWLADDDDKDARYEIKVANCA